MSITGDELWGNVLFYAGLTLRVHVGAMRALPMKDPEPLTAFEHFE